MLGDHFAEQGVELVDGLFAVGELGLRNRAVAVEAFDTEEILGKLSDYGIQSRVEGESTVVPLRSYISMRMPNRGGVEGGTPELYFTDPDGLRIQLQDTTYCGGGGYLGQVCI